MPIRTKMSGKRFVALCAIVGALLGGFFAPNQAAAHPLGNFTINQYSRVEVTADGPRVVYVLDLAEVPAFQELQVIDGDGDRRVSEAEQDAYLPAKLAEIERGLTLTVDGEAVSVRPSETTLSFPDGQAGLTLVRLRTIFVSQWPLIFTGGEQAVGFENLYAADRLGWREIVVTHGAGVALAGIAVPDADATDELRAYPEDLLGSPLDQRAVAFGVRLAAGAPAAAGFARFVAGTDTGGATATARPDGGGSGGRFAALLDDRDLTTSGTVFALLAAMVWGAAHALSPGHGKTVVGAYLVGSRGTPRHAAFLGATVTVTHTAGVIALGLVTLFASRYVVPETLFPWLSVSSGILVVVMGLWTLRMRLRGEPGFGHHHHEHDHAHDHDHGHHHHHGDGMLVHSHGGHTHSHQPPERISWRGLLALGVSGGLIPCPSALVVLLGAIALGRVGFGLALVVAFSLGLAATLTGLGMLFLYAGRFFARRLQPEGRLGLILRFGPAAGSVVLTIAGVAIIVRALGETGWR